MALVDASPSNEVERDHALIRALTLTYGVVAYCLFLATFLYTIAWTGGALLPTTIDDGVAGSGARGAVVNILLLGLFGLQHTVMARPAFKQWWTSFVPEQIERSTFVLTTCAILALLFWQWRSFPTEVWRFEGAAAIALHVLFFVGFGIVLISTFLIDHFHLFGVKQTLMYARGHKTPEPVFLERLFYRYVRHPLMLGFMIAFWAAPVMTMGHLLFATVTTAYILLALAIEEQTLRELHGKAYEDYCRRVPKLIPRFRSS